MPVCLWKFKPRIRWATAASSSIVERRDFDLVLLQRHDPAESLVHFPWTTSAFPYFRVDFNAAGSDYRFGTQLE